MAYWVYMRVSTKTQAEKNSTENQKEGIYKYVEDHGIDVAGEFSDEGISGAIDKTASDDAIHKRVGLIELLGTAKKGDTIIVQNTSRLWRSDTAKVLVRRELMKNSLKIIAVDNPDYDLYTKDPVEMLMNGIMEILDEYEKMTIAIKLARGRMARAKNGYKACGTAPIGYMWKGNNVVVDRTTSDMVRFIFQTYIETGSLKRTVGILSSMGHLTNRGNEFSTMAISRILNNDYYIGIVTHAGIKSKGHHLPLIDQETFDKAQALLRKSDPRNTMGGPRPRKTNDLVPTNTRTLKPRITPEERVRMMQEGRAV